MDIFIALAGIAVVVLVSIFVIKMLFGPMKLIFKLLINTGVGFVLLFIVNFICEFWDFNLGFSPITALIVGIFGVPSVIVLILIKLFL